MNEKDLRYIAALATKVGRYEAEVIHARNKLENLRGAARGGAFVVGTYDAQKLVDHWEDRLRVAREDLEKAIKELSD